MVDDNPLQWQEQGLRNAVLRGDQEAWRLLYDQCFDSLYAFIDFRTGHRRDRTEEVVQEVWLVAVRRIAVFDPARSSFETWLRGIAVNVIRNQSRRWPPAETVRPLEVAFGESGPEPSFDLAEQIGLAMTALPVRYRSVIQAKYQDKLSVVEIARQWQETPKAVESLLTRARKTFRKIFTGLEQEH